MPQFKIVAKLASYAPHLMKSCSAMASWRHSCSIWNPIRTKVAL